MVSEMLFDPFNLISSLASDFLKPPASPTRTKEKPPIEHTGPGSGAEEDLI